MLYVQHRNAPGVVVKNSQKDICQKLSARRAFTHLLHPFQGDRKKAHKSYTDLAMLLLLFSSLL
jgi:hypothetical protein